MKTTPENERDAVVLLDKNSGVTSFTCLNQVKRSINHKTGHCGTLDKFASGLIIALCGKYTKLNPLFMGLDKTYCALIEFGKETDTLDPEGSVIKTADIPSYSTVESSVKSLCGKIMQVPPVYSALHINGKRSYLLARSGVQVCPQAREVTIYSAEIVSYEKPFLKVILHVSKGTYIRSYARDIGILCNSCAYVKELRRTSVGPFSVDEAIDCNDVDAYGLIKEEDTYSIIEKLEKYRRESLEGNRLC